MPALPNPKIHVLVSWWQPEGTGPRFNTYEYNAEKQNNEIRFNDGKWRTNLSKLKSGDYIAIREGQTGFGGPMKILAIGKVLNVGRFHTDHQIAITWRKRYPLGLMLDNNQNLKDQFIAPVNSQNPLYALLMEALSAPLEAAPVSTEDEAIPMAIEDEANPMVIEEALKEAE